MEQRPRHVLIVRLAMITFAVVACTGRMSERRTSGPQAPPAHSVIPVPASVTPGDGGDFALTSTTRIVTPAGSAEATRIGEQIAVLLRRSTGFELPVVQTGKSANGDVTLTLTPGDAQRGAEGYVLAVTSTGVTMTAAEPDGLFRAVQTLRQLLPAAIEGPSRQSGPWRIAAVRIVDQPRFAWRGAMLDVARHFFSVEEVKQYVDAIALYKINRLHLHLSDDQGWRIEIRARPRLTSHGGSTEVGGGPGGFYTQADYTEIVDYARERYITIVPEIDLPGHTNAALASYPELTCDGAPPELYTGVQVGFSSLCVGNEATYAFVDDVMTELAELTPGPYLHVGGDEVETLSAADYTRFVERVESIVRSHGKSLVGWEEVAQAALDPTSVAQYWNTKGDNSKRVAAAAAKGIKVILSPAAKTYLDMKYDKQTKLGLEWAGLISVKTAYDWEPTSILPGVEEAAILGVEAPLWSETVEDIDDVESMAFPRLTGIAEVGWSPAASRDVDGYLGRVAQHGARWQAMGVDYHRAAGVDWP